MKIVIDWKIGVPLVAVVVFLVAFHVLQAPRESCTHERRHLYIDNAAQVLVHAMADPDNLLFYPGFKNDYPVDLSELGQQIEFDQFDENRQDSGFYLHFKVTRQGVTFFPSVGYDGSCRYRLSVSHHMRELGNKESD